MTPEERRAKIREGEEAERRVYATRQMPIPPDGYKPPYGRFSTPGEGPDRGDEGASSGIVPSLFERRDLRRLSQAPVEQGRST
jgi:peptidoglycan/xylan/chitin deacetylase (PgdA/CDA1 family)